MEELENIAQQAFYLLIGGTAIAAENLDRFVKEFPEQIQNITEDAIAKGEETYQSWCDESELSENWDNSTSSEVSSALRRKLFSLVNGNWSLAERLLERVRQDNPDRTEAWYYEKVIYDLERDRA